MKICALFGGPRPKGNTALLLDSAVEGAKDAGADVEVIRMAGLNVSPCLDCGGCTQDGACIQHDDMDLVFQSLDRADALILASPVYFSSVSAQAKIVIDRCQAYWTASQRSRESTTRSGRRPAMLIATAGRPDPRGDLFVPVLAVARALFVSLNARLTCQVLVADTDQAPVRDRPPALQAARAAGRDLVTQIQSIALGNSVSLPLP